MKYTVTLLSVLVIAGAGASASPAHKTDYSMQAFGGLLIGIDRGEWVGRLQFQDPSGNVHTILEKNVLGITKNKDGIFVFTGLAHMSLNEGQVYVVKPGANHIPRPELLTRLAGAPSKVHQELDGTISFLVFTGNFDRQGRAIYECYQLVGQVVSRGTGCLPPQRVSGDLATHAARIYFARTRGPW